MFSQVFIKEAKELYPTWDSLHKAIAGGNIGIVQRYLDDATDDSINYKEVLSAGTLEELKGKARILERKVKLKHEAYSGHCFVKESDRRECFGCPRLYAQMNDDDDALKAFNCIGVFHIPDCPKFKSGECWKRFDDLGLKLQ